MGGVVSAHNPLTSWGEVLRIARLSTGRRLWYKAPLDLHAYPVLVRWVFKNEKIRVMVNGCVFTVDSGHLDRFSVRGLPCTGFDGCAFGVGDVVDGYGTRGIVTCIVPTERDRVRVQVSDSADWQYFGPEAAFKRVGPS